MEESDQHSGDDHNARDSSPSPFEIEGTFDAISDENMPSPKNRGRVSIIENKQASIAKQTTANSQFQSVNIGGNLKAMSLSKRNSKKKAEDKKTLKIEDT